jgi:hypothetical protein
MAVRDDFQVGEVLKSEDLNDTFASKADSTDLTGSNLIYNGAMQVAQRGTSTSSITTEGYYTADRWTMPISGLGTWTQSVESDAPTGSGFRKSLKVLCTTADASPAAGDFLVIAQKLEGQDVQRIAKGTSAAQQLTFSFWVKSNVTGTYVAELVDDDNTRRISLSYSVAASATWERKTLTFSADTSGVLNNDNATSLICQFWLGAGSTFSGGSPLQTTWGTATNTRATGQTNLAAATDNYWQVTGVQLEVGPAATAFEFKSFGQELRECLRYYEKSFEVGTAPAEGQSQFGTAARTQSWATGRVFIIKDFLVEKRGSPTVTLFNPRSGGTAGRMTDSVSDDTSATSAVNVTTKGFMGQAGGASLAANNWYVHFTASSEL